MVLVEDPPRLLDIQAVLGLRTSLGQAVSRVVRDFRSRAREQASPGTASRLEIDLSDQFGDVTITVLKPEGFCTPVDQHGEGIYDPNLHMTCYM